MLDVVLLFIDLPIYESTMAPTLVKNFNFLYISQSTNSIITEIGNTIVTVNKN